MRILSLLFMLMLACADAQAQQWSAYQSPDGRYKVDMPGKPSVDRAPVKLNDGGTVTNVEVMVELGDQAFLAIHTDFAPGTFASVGAQQALINGRDAATTNRRLLSDRSLTIAGYPAREYVFETKDDLILLCRAALARNRMFQAIAVYPAGKPEPAEARRFINSFDILPQ